MKRFSSLTHALVKTLSIALILSACGAGNAPETTPTINPVDQAVGLQGTIIAAGYTNVAGTQTALPTATPSPTSTVTNTPAATSTFPALPTLDATFTAAPGGNSAANDPCINQVMPASLEGETIRIRIDNPVNATIMLSVNLHQAGPQGQCGYRSYSLAPQESLVINDLVVGCYTLWAWNPDPQEYFMVTNGTSCLNTSQTWAFDITTSTIRLR